MKKKPTRKPRYYDVERFRRVYLETLRKRKGIWKFLGRITHALDSVQGFFIALLVPVVIFGTVIGVAVGSFFGPLVFVAIFGGIIGGLALFAEKRVGRSMQFGDYSFLRRTLAQLLAFLMMGVIVLIIAAIRFNLLKF